VNAKLCKDCRWFEDPGIPICKHPATESRSVSVHTGILTITRPSILLARKVDYPCAKEGRLFEPVPVRWWQFWKRP
jgi:hypothetical protein